jgi:hypothetical protein
MKPWEKGEPGEKKGMKDTEAGECAQCGMPMKAGAMKCAKCGAKKAMKGIGAIARYK